MAIVEVLKYPSRSQWALLQQRPFDDVSELHDTVRSVLEDVRLNGDEAIRRYTERFDKVVIDGLQVSNEEFLAAEASVSTELKDAISVATNNITSFHAAQRFEMRNIATMPGVECWQKAVAIEKIGLYVPGGTAPLFSTVMMLAVPAVIAGCGEIVLCTPPAADGSIHPAVLYTARACGVSKVFKVGGAQAIAAMAYGTESIPKVYKIFGPGNRYVTAAKQLVSLQDVAIDMPAGPSEVMIIADAEANPAFIAADFLSQAEHGADSQSILLTSSEQLAADVALETERQLASLPRREYIDKSLSHSKIIILKDFSEIIDFSNRYAPEHLIIQTANYADISTKIVNAGSAFLGAYSPESAGDYASGTNHTLPTKGFVHMYSGVNLDSFVKKITFQELTREGLQTLAPTIEILAAAESLEAHKNAVSIRVRT